MPRRYASSAGEPMVFARLGIGRLGGEFAGLRVGYEAEGAFAVKARRANGNDGCV